MDSFSFVDDLAVKGWFSIALHKLLRREPRQRGRQVNINEVSEEMNNQDSRYQRGHVINICGQRLNMDSPFKPLAHGYSMCQHKCSYKTHILDLSGMKKQTVVAIIWPQLLAEIETLIMMSSSKYVALEVIAGKWHLDTENLDVK